MIPADSPYWDQVRLLVQILPAVAQEECFALKGGTAINLFIRDMPRLSVDIDLAYLPVSDYETAREGINAALLRIRDDLLNSSHPYVVTTGSNDGAGKIDTLNVEMGDAQVKIELNPVLRGSVNPVQVLGVRPVVEERAGFARITVLAPDDVYAGKLVAALDRQHPRDLFDVMLLFENEGLGESLFKTFLVYLVGHKASMADTLNPNRKPLEKLFREQFETMAARETSVKELLEVRERLIREVHKRLGDKEKRFLLSVKQIKPDWNLLGVPGVEALPAVRWKLHNLGRMSKPAHEKAVARLSDLFQKI
jgi:predicted nucleotidyltransferase component of viral defense system